MVKQINSKSIFSVHPSAFLLFVQIASLFLYAGFEGIPSGRAMIGIAGVLVLLLAVWVVNRSPSANWIAWTLAILVFILSLLSELVESNSMLIVASIIEAVLYFYTAGSLIAYMMEDSNVTTDEMFAAAATFTVLAWGFAYLYLACQTLFPDSFITANLNQPQTFLELLFLSFANLSATGLSDILPVTSPARVLVMLEQFAGVAYITVVVSRLVGLTILRRGNKSSR
ncbi:MAG: hypothetical protein MHPDNHAH_02840 [Anaerolineales bacterium]|nr:hypothetical protein [Anaerolineales bacterium]WKZ48820.1 MAG: ion channel [Anaerolineales bacterium]